jgi:NRPS condensation-like uncharacterized protein
LLTYPSTIEPERLAGVVKKVVESHPGLSVHFVTDGDKIMQTLTDAATVTVPITRMSDEELATYKNEFVRPFNLQKAPLYRLEVVKTEESVHLLMDIHHLIFDGGSADLLIRQINDALEGKSIENETYSFLYLHSQFVLSCYRLF